MPNFPLRGEDNWGHIVFRHLKLLYKENIMTVSEKSSVLGYLVHELAHQWTEKFVKNEMVE